MIVCVFEKGMFNLRLYMTQLQMQKSRCNEQCAVWACGILAIAKNGSLNHDLLKFCMDIGIYWVTAVLAGCEILRI